VVTVVERHVALAGYATPMMMMMMMMDKYTNPLKLLQLFKQILRDKAVDQSASFFTASRYDGYRQLYDVCQLFSRDAVHSILFSKHDTSEDG